MTKSNHQDYLRVSDDSHIVFRPVDQDATKFDVLRFERQRYDPDTIQKVSQTIRQKLKPSFLSRDIVKKYPDGHTRWNRPLFGYCVPSSFALLFLIDTDRLHPMTGSDPEGENHWWIEDMDTGDRYDPTSDQYSPDEQEFVYRSGKPKRLYSFQGRPQKRVLDLISTVQPDATRYTTDDLNQDVSSLEGFLT